MRRAQSVVAMFVALVTASNVAACAGKHSGESELPAVTVPAGLDAFYAQRVNWQECGTGETGGWLTGEPDAGLTCAYITAPLDYTAARDHAIADVATVQLAVARRAATGTKTGSLLSISGGPGQTGLAAAEGAVPDEVRESYDLVGYDPRGVGRSVPQIRCFPGESGDAPDPVTGEEQANRATVANCVRDTGADLLRHIGPDEAVNDVDLIRAILGEPRINLIAASYGTQVAAMYALRFPGNYRAAILDGVVDIAETQDEMLVGQKRGYQDSFDRLAAFCTSEYQASTHAECPLGAEPGAAQQTFQQLLRDADANPVPVPGSEPVAAGSILGATTNGLLWRSEWVPYLQALDGVRHGDGTAVQRLSKMFDNPVGQDDSSGLPAPRQPATDPAAAAADPNAITAITCADTAEPTNDRAVRQHAAIARYEAAPYQNYEPRPAEFPLDVCDLWPFAGAVHPVVPSRADGAAPLLFVAQRHDPTTPAANAERMAQYMRSPLLIRESDGHTFVFGGVSSCIDDEVVRYLRDPRSVQPKTCQE
ncbi:alpha/beta hydrolase [Nocardia sp. NPDC020380]|uniref:alpha/beta hydrolase n=1 Tax=Nocardia sp. NPDC020380 TaxID=3364309 RepID=UPI0037888E83